MSKNDRLKRSEELAEDEVSPDEEEQDEEEESPNQEERVGELVTFIEQKVAESAQILEDLFQKLAANKLNSDMVVPEILTLLNQKIDEVVNYYQTPEVQKQLRINAEKALSKYRIACKDRINTDTLDSFLIAVEAIEFAFEEAENAGLDITDLKQKRQKIAAKNIKELLSNYYYFISQCKEDKYAPPLSENYDYLKELVYIGYSIFRDAQNAGINLTLYEDQGVYNRYGDGYTLLNVSYGAAEAELKSILEDGCCLLGWQKPEEKVVEIKKQISVLQKAGVDISNLNNYLSQVEKYLRKLKKE